MIYKQPIHFQDHVQEYNETGWEKAWLVKGININSIFREER